MALNPTAEDEEILDLFLDKIKNEYKDAWTEENWEEEMEKHPLFMTKAPDENTELSPQIEALRQLRWDPDDGPKEKALKFKEDGNFYFKCKNYKNAVISYTAGLNEKIDDDKELMSVLHSNRAASHFYLENYRSCLNDCVFARKFNPKNLKAVTKGAECCYKLKSYDDCIKWCESGLSINSSDEKLKNLRSDSEIAKKTFEKEKRKKETIERKKTERQTKIFRLIKSFGIRVQEKEKEFMRIIDDPSNPLEKVVQLSEDETSLVWPVVFLYPEHGQTDFIEAFDQNSTIEDHLQIVFEQSPEWDTKKEYRLDNINIYYENRDQHKFTKIKPSYTLLKVLKSEGYIVQQASPNFFIMVKNSPFEKIYLEKYSQIN